MARQPDVHKFLFIDEDRKLSGEVLNDPLGLMTIWSSFGRDLVPHLTTISSNIRLFHCALLALERIAHWEATAGGGSARVFDARVFAFEQLAVHVQMRCYPKDSAGLRGVRVARRLVGEPKVHLGQTAPCLLLSSHRGNGMFAAVRGPFRRMGLTGADDRLRPKSLEKTRKLFASLAGEDGFRDLTRMIDRMLRILRRGQLEALVRFSYGFNPQRVYDLLKPVVLKPRHIAASTRFWEEFLGGVWDKTKGKRVVHESAQAVVDCILKEKCRTTESVIKRLKRHRLSKVADAAKRIHALEDLLCLVEPAFDVLSRCRDMSHAVALIRPNVKLISKRAEVLRSKLIGNHPHKKSCRWLCRLAGITNADEMARAFVKRHMDSTSDRMRQPWVRLAGDDIESDLPVLSADEGRRWLREQSGVWRRGYFIPSVVSVLTADVKTNQEADE